MRRRIAEANKVDWPIPRYRKVTINLRITDMASFYCVDIYFCVEVLGGEPAPGRLSGFSRNSSGTAGTGTFP
jgi:hypothetical protein